MTKQQSRLYAAHLSDTVTMGAAGAGKAFADNLYNLHDQLEAILAADGQKAKCSRIVAHFRVTSESVFSVAPIIVQTAGNFTDTVDLASGIVDVNLDSCIDDVFGYLLQGNILPVARRIPSSDSTAASGQEMGREFAYQVPGHIIQLLNKEVETEKLQNLFLGLYGVAAGNNQLIYIEIDLLIEFIGTRKTIIIR